MAKKGVAAILTAVEKTINTLGKAINTATEGLTTAFKAVGKVVSFAANIVGDALSAISSIFEIQKLWMAGDLAVLNDKQSGNLGIEVAILGKTYLHETKWNFNNPIEDLVKMVAGGGAPSGKEKSYSTAPATRTNKKAQGIAKALIEKASYATPPMPYNPRTCEVYPYLLDSQIIEAKANLGSLTGKANTNLLLAFVAAMEQAPRRKEFSAKGCWVCFYKDSRYRGTSYCKSGSSGWVGKSFND